MPSDWNPQNDLQAQARCHRLGQDKAVNVYRLVTNNCYEEAMFKKSIQKLTMDQLLLTGGGGGGGGAPKANQKEMDNLIKCGAVSRQFFPPPCSWLIGIHLLLSFWPPTLQCLIVVASVCCASMTS